MYAATGEVKPYVEVSDRHESEQSQSEVMLNSARLSAQGSQTTNLTCLEGHPIRLLPQGFRKLRKDAKGRVS